LAEKHGLLILEDAALAAGANYQGRRTGGLGNAGAFSFAPGKVLGGIGWSGMFTTDDHEVAVRARQLAGYGPSECEVETVDCVEGYNAQMSALQAADLRVKLRQLDIWVAKRRRNAALYDEACDRLGIRRLHPRPWTEPSYRVYAIYLDGRDEAIRIFQESGVRTLAYYAIPLHLRPAFARFGYHPGDFPIAEKVTQDLLCLPVHPHLTDEQIRKVIDALERIQ
jgi:dTDP-4-amino-4,6-dideoxygalactose transaminase